MSLLLDTHALVWAVGSPDRLGDDARKAIEDAGRPLFVSAATSWEIATKRRLGKMSGVDALTANYARVLRRLGVASIPIADEHALLAGSLEWTHRDPFDRMRAAVALTEGLTLVTRDPAFGSLREVRTLW